MWDPARAPGRLGAEQEYTLGDALAVGVWLNVFVRQARRLGMCNVAQSVNVISPLRAHAGGLARQPTWYPLWLFARLVRGAAVAAHVRCGGYGGPTAPAWLRGVLAPDGAPWLDVSASVVDGHELEAQDGEWEGGCGAVATLVVVNIHPERDITAELRGPTGLVRGYRVHGEALDSVNVAGAEEQVGLSEFRWEAAEGSFTFAKHSLTMLRWSVR